MNVEIPDKLYFKIGEVAKMADVPTHVIRYWESEFPTIKPKRANSKQRLFKRQDVELILKIKRLLHHQGYTIAGAKKLISEGGAEADSSLHLSAKRGRELSKELENFKQELKSLQNLLKTKK